MQATAALFERHQHRVEITPRRHAWRRERSLHAPDMIDENLVIVQPAEHLLHPFQGAQFLRALQAARLDVELEAVAQLLERDARRVQPLGQIHGAGLVDRLAQRERPAADARVERPQPARRAWASSGPSSLRAARRACARFDGGARGLLGGHVRAGLVPAGARRVANEPERGLGERPDSCSSAIRSSMTSASRTRPSRLVTLRS